MARGANKPRASARALGTSKNDGSKKISNGESAIATQSNMAQDLQQSCLNIFRDALKPSTDDVALVQKVKGHLFNRDFNVAFGREDYLRVYASRWSPSRALCYLQILDNVQDDILSNNTMSLERSSSQPFRVVCLGGGAGGELVAFAGWLRSVTASEGQDSPTSLHVDLLDSADWNKVTASLFHAITTPPELSPYASQAKKESNKALLQPEDVSMSFRQLDLLNAEELTGFEDFSKADLVTCMFTLNELYSTSMANTQRFIFNLSASMRPGSCFLVVDSPGSYSTVSVNGSEKKYPMQWLLDYTLRGSPGKAKGPGCSWERLESSDSQWFRRPQGLQYPIELEDMRYQLHLYRKADIGDTKGNHGG